jgi:hypothetical protein
VNDRNPPHAKGDIMPTVADSLIEELILELSRASAEYSQAAGQLRDKDTPANRALVAECSTKINSLLDMYLDAGAAGAGGVGGSPADEQDAVGRQRDLLLGP